MAFFETLQYTDGGGAQQEVALQNLGTGGTSLFRIIPRSHAASECQITLAQPPETAIVVPFKSQCIVWANRQAATAAGPFSGGQKIFQGRRTDNMAAASASRISNQIVLSDALWDLKHITFQNGWKIITGGTVAAPIYGLKSSPDVVLFQPAPTEVYNPVPLGGHITTWQQIKDIVAYATSAVPGINLQLAANPEFTPSYVQWYPVRSMKCADCITVCLRPHPGVFTEIDYTTTPPTLHFRNADNMTALTLPYKSTDGNGIMHIASDIQPLPDLIPDRVSLYYKINSSLNGQSVIDFSTDTYPPGAPASLLSHDYSVDITGTTSQITVKNFTAAAFSPLDLNLWRTKVPGLAQQLNGGQIPNDGNPGALTLVDANPRSGAHPKGIIVEDENHNPIDYAGTYIYVTDDDVMAWFKLNGGASALAIRATVKAFFTYQKISTIQSTQITDQQTEHEQSMRVLLTNAPSGLYILSQVLNTGEAIPPNLAQNIYTELQQMQWKLRHEIIQVGAPIPTIVKPGLHAINLSGGDPTWVNMLAVPQEVQIEFTRAPSGPLIAHHTISCGPVNSLEPGYMVQLYNLFTNRDLSKIDPNQRLTGFNSSNESDLSQSAAKENSIPSLPLPAASNVVFSDPGNANQVTHTQVNSQTGEIFQKQFTAAGAKTGPSVSSKLSDLADATNQDAKFQWVQMCDASGNTLKAKFMSTNPEAA